MNIKKTPDKVRCRLKPGQVAVHQKWKNSVLHEGLKESFNSVQCTDLGSYDVHLSDLTFIYVAAAQLSNNSVINDLISTDAEVVIAERNITTVDLFTKFQESMMKSGRSVLPVGHLGEVSLIVHQFHLSSSISSPGSTFETIAKAPPDIQVKLLLNIPGLGQTKAKKLLDTFGTIQRISFSKKDDLIPVIGKASAEEVVQFFQKVNPS